MSTEENKAVVRRLLDEIWHRRNVTIVDELFANNFTSHLMPPELPPGRQGTKQVTRMMLDAARDYQIAIDEMVAEGDKVAFRWRLSFTQTGQFMGIAPTSKRVMLTGIEILRLVDGRIVEQWAVEDMLGLLQQLGALPALDQAPAS